MRARPPIWLALLLLVALGCGDPATSSAPATASAPVASAVPHVPPGSRTLPAIAADRADEVSRLRRELQELRATLVEVDAALASAVLAVANATTERDLIAAKLQVARLQKQRAELRIRSVKLERLLQPPHGPPYQPLRHIGPECLKRAFSPRCR